MTLIAARSLILQLTTVTIAFALSVLFYALTMPRNVNPYDEGVILTGAMRVAAGELPHRDFYANYGPAQFYILAGLFKVFGQSIMVERAYDVLIRATATVVCYTLLTAYCRRFIAWTATAVCALSLTSVGNFYGYPIFPALLSTLMGAWLLLPFLEGERRAWRVLGAGMTTGMAALFRYDVGFFILVAQSLALACLIVPKAGNLLESLRATATAIIFLAIGTGAVFLPAALFYVSISPLAPFLHDIITFPAENYARTRSLPFPGILEALRHPRLLAVYLPILACCLAVASLGLKHSGGGMPALSQGARAEHNPTTFILLLGLLSAFLYLKGLVRVSPIHMLLSLVPSLMLLAVLVELAVKKALPLTLRSLIVAMSALALASTLSGSLYAAKALARDNFVVAILFGRAPQPATSRTSWCGTPVDLPRIACFSIGDDRAEATRFVIQNTTKDERIFVGLTRHDKVFANDNVTYFAAGRLPGTHWHHFDPGLQTEADIQANIIDELEAGAVRYIVLNSEWNDVSEANDSSKSSHIFLLDDYLRAHYRKVRDFGSLQVLIRSGA